MNRIYVIFSRRKAVFKTFFSKIFQLKHLEAFGEKKMGFFRLGLTIARIFAFYNSFLHPLKEIVEMFY